MALADHVNTTLQQVLPNIQDAAHKLKLRRELRSHSVNGYSAIGFTPERIHEVCKNLMGQVAKWQDDQADCIAVTGSSGLSVAMLLVHVYDCPLPILYVRKPGESDHGHAIELISGDCYGRQELHMAVFIDDFVCTGITERRVKAALADYGTDFLYTVSYTQL